MQKIEMRPTMTDQREIGGQRPVKMNGWPADWSGALQKVALATGVLVIFFSLPLYRWVRFSLHSDLYSHLVLVPFISVYLAWSNRNALSTRSAPNRVLAALLLAAGLAALIGFFGLIHSGAHLETEDSLALSMLSFALLFGGICAFYLGRDVLRRMAFPLGFLIFVVPLPAFLITRIETLLQHGSAYVASFFFTLAGTPVFRHELVFQLKGISLEVAPECSGIHSSLALFITSLVAGYLFLRSPVSRTALALAVIPLALLRNGFRVFTIGELCVHIGPDMINSYIHRHGGPMFFTLFLVPFFFVLFALLKIEHAKRP